jgi:hypothetical protein
MRSRALPPEPAYDERPRRGLSLSSLGAPGRRFDAGLNVPEADSRLQSDAVLASLPADPAREVRASIEAHHRFATARAVARSTPGRRDTDSPEADLSGGRAVDARRSAGAASRIADGFDAVAIRVATACAAPVASRRRRRGHPVAGGTSTRARAARSSAAARATPGGRATRSARCTAARPGGHLPVDADSRAPGAGRRRSSVREVDCDHLEAAATARRAGKQDKKDRRGKRDSLASRGHWHLGGRRSIRSPRRH